MIVELKLLLTWIVPMVSLTAAVALPRNSRVPPASVTEAALRNRSLLTAAELSMISEPPRFTVALLTLGSAPAAPARTTAPPAALMVRAPENRLAPVRFRKPEPLLLRDCPAITSPTPPA